MPNVVFFGAVALLLAVTGLATVHPPVSPSENAVLMAGIDASGKEMENESED